MKEKIIAFIRDERGFSVKSLAITVGAIVVIGAIVTWLSQGQLADWVTEVWEAIWDWIQSTFMT